MRLATLPPLALLLLCLAGEAPAKDKGEVFYPGRAEIAPFPREVPLSPPLELKVRPGRGFQSPVISVTDPGGKTKYVHPERTVDGWLIFTLDFERKKGPHRVELVVDSDRGDTTAAQFTLWVGVKKPKDDAVPAPRPETEYEPDSGHLLMLERKLFRHINGYRKLNGLKPYPWLEKAAYLGREHMRAFLKMRPRPKKLTHLIPSFGSIADRFEDFFAWPQTIRKFPQVEPEVGPEATCYCSESLAQLRSVDWLFNEVYLRESAFRAPILSTYPTHVAVGMVKDEKTGRIYCATVFVQVNSTRVMKEMEKEFQETLKLASEEKDPATRASLLRRLGRMGDPRTFPLFVRRLNAKTLPAPVRGAALDSLFLNDPARAEKWVERHRFLLLRARETEDYRHVLPSLAAMAALDWNEEVRAPATRELTFITKLAEYELRAAERSLSDGDREEAARALASIAERFPGLPAADRAKTRLSEIGKE